MKKITVQLKCILLLFTDGIKIFIINKKWVVKVIALVISAQSCIGIIPIFAQDSSHIKISLLTCTPGDDLDETFGHSAIRVTDSTTTTDIVFNYGTFDFASPGFYTKFIRGKLMYYVSVDKFEDFKSYYQSVNRGITEQILNLTGSEKVEIEEFLYHNAKEENKYYKYDFFLDNCTTRLRDIIVKYKSSHPELKPVMPEGTKFRKAIHLYLDKNGKDWSKLGIDLLLGAPTDAIMTTKQTEFLPDNLMKALDSSNFQHQLVKSETQLFSHINKVKEGSFFSPMLVFTLLLLIIILLTYADNKKVHIFLNGFDGLMFFLTGLFGFLFIFMWVGTEHTMVKNNYNLIWAWPIHVVIAFFVSSKKNWVKKYFLFTCIGLIIVLLSWFFVPQQMNNALLPVIFLLLLRAYYRYQAV